MSYTNGDDPRLDAEIEGAIARNAGEPLLGGSNPYANNRFTATLSASWCDGWRSEDAKIKAARKAKTT